MKNTTYENSVAYEKRKVYSVLLDKSLSDRARLIYVYLGVTPRRKWQSVTALCRDVGFDLGLSKNCIRKYINELIMSGVIMLEDLLEKGATIPKKMKIIKETTDIPKTADLRRLFNEWYQEKESTCFGQFKKDYLSTMDVCQLFKVTKPTLWRWQKKKYLVPVKIGRKNLYKRSDIKELMATK